jgi:hypothetical protein
MGICSMLVTAGGRPPSSRTDRRLAVARAEHHRFRARAFARRRSLHRTIHRRRRGLRTRPFIPGGARVARRARSADRLARKLAAGGGCRRCTAGAPRSRQGRPRPSGVSHAMPQPPSFWKTDIFLTTGWRRGFLVIGTLRDVRWEESEFMLYSTVKQWMGGDVESDSPMEKSPQAVKSLKTAMKIAHSLEGSWPRSKWTEKGA